MKSLLKVIAFILITFVVVGLFLPTHYQFSREQIIEASPLQIHTHVGNLQNWPSWSPWKFADPSIQIKLGALTSGVGAHQSWTGESGSGELTFTHSDPKQGIDYDLLFDGQWAAKSTIRYQSDQTGSNNQTTVIWSMKGDAKVPIIGGYLALAMEPMTGPMFSTGLNKLKSQVELSGHQSP